MAGELNDILAQLEAELAPLQGEPQELDGGITNRNFRVTLGGLDYVVRRPGKDTELLGIDRAAERLWRRIVSREPETPAFGERRDELAALGRLRLVDHAERPSEN